MCYDTCRHFVNTLYLVSGREYFLYIAGAKAAFKTCVEA